MSLSSNTFSDPAFLAAALEGLESQKRRLDDQIAEVRRLLGGGAARKAAKAAPVVSADGAVAKPRRQMSASARKRIAEAQKKRWAEYRKQQEA